MFKTLIITILLFISPKIFAAKIGVLVPLENESLNSIVEGIKEILKDQNVDIVVRNAQGDLNIQHSIIKQFRDDNSISIVMPIGIAASQMTIAHIKDRPIICVAANSNLRLLQNKFVTGVDDTDDKTNILKLLESIPNIDSIALIYSASEKIISQVNEIEKLAKLQNIKLHLSMVQNLNDLQSAVRASPQDIKAYLILKDITVVSGVNIILSEAYSRQIPLLSSDEGSVHAGAIIGIGVREKDIGIQSGLIAKDVLQGVEVDTIPFKTIDNLTLFINNDSVDKQNILTKADILKLPFKNIEIVNNLKKY